MTTRAKKRTAAKKQTKTGKKTAAKTTKKKSKPSARRQKPTAPRKKKAANTGTKRTKKKPKTRAKSKKVTAKKKTKPASKPKSTAKKKAKRAGSKTTRPKKAPKRTSPASGIRKTGGTSPSWQRADSAAAQTRLEGKRFYLDKRSRQTQLSTLIKNQGGRIDTSVKAKTDYFYSALHNESLIAEVHRLNESKGASIKILDRSELADVITPDRETLIGLLKAGGEYIDYWNLLANLRAPERHWEPFTGNRMDVAATDFRKFDLTRANLNFANIDRCDFRNATLTNVRIGAVAHAKFDRAELQPWQLGPAHDCSFRGCTLHELIQSLDLISCNLERARFVGLRSGNAKAQDCVFDKANFQDAQLRSAKFRGNSFRGADFSRSKLYQCDLSSSDLTGANFREADLRHIRLCDANLSNADFRNANLLLANLENAVVDGANFEGAQLASAYTEGVKVASARGLKRCIAEAEYVEVVTHYRTGEPIAVPSDQGSSATRIAGTFVIYSLDWDKFQEFTTQPTNQQLRRLAKRYYGGANESRLAELESRLAQRDWNDGLTIIEMQRFERAIESFCAHDERKLGFRSETDTITIDLRVQKRRQRFELEKLGERPFRYRGKPWRRDGDFEPTHSMHTPGEVQKLVEELESADTRVMGESAAEELLTVLEQVADERRLLFVMVDT